MYIDDFMMSATTRWRAGDMPRSERDGIVEMLRRYISLGYESGWFWLNRWERITKHGG